MLQMPRPQQGNPKPRLFRIPEAEGVINRINNAHSLLAGFMERFRGVSMRRLGAYLAWFKWTRGFAPAGGCSYSFVNWEMLSVRPDRGMLTPSH